MPRIVYNFLKSLHFRKHYFDGLLTKTGCLVLCTNALHILVLRFSHHMTPSHSAHSALWFTRRLKFLPQYLPTGAQRLTAENITVQKLLT